MRHHYISECPEEVKEVSGAAGLQHQIHGQTLGLTVQHPHHILMFTHSGMEEDPLHKFLSLRQVGAVYIWSQMTAEKVSNLLCFSMITTIDKDQLPSL